MKVSLKKAWKNEYFQTAFVVGLVVALVFGFWYGSQFVLNTEIPPALAVVSGSMDTVSDGRTPGWTHPFARTLQIGDLIIIQGVPAEDLKTSYPDSDIIVYQRPDDPSELIVHRITEATMIDGKMYFFTKGDGNPPVTWPAQLTPYMYDQWTNPDSNIPKGAVSEDLVVGKVVMRVPLIGYVPMSIQYAASQLGIADFNFAIPLIILLIILLVIVEFIIPMLRQKQNRQNEEGSQRPAENST